MPKIFPIIKRSSGDAPAEGTPNFTVNQKVGFRTTLRFVYDAISHVKAGVSISPSFSIRTPVDVGFSVASRVDQQSQIDQKVGIKLENRLTVSGVENKAGVSISEFRCNNTYRKGANSVVEQTSDGGRADWTNDANAQGNHNGSVANFAGSAAGARAGTLVLQYANMLSKTVLEISAARLHFYYRVAGTALNNAEFTLRYRLDGDTTFATATHIISVTSDANTLTVPRTEDITIPVGGDWSKIDGLVVFAKASAALGETWTAELDAVELEVVSSVLEVY